VCASLFERLERRADTRHGVPGVDDGDLLSIRSNQDGLYRVWRMAAAPAHDLPCRHPTSVPCDLSDERVAARLELTPRGPFGLVELRHEVEIQHRCHRRPRVERDRPPMAKFHAADHRRRDPRAGRDVSLSETGRCPRSSEPVADDRRHGIDGRTHLVMV